MFVCSPQKYWGVHVARLESSCFPPALVTRVVFPKRGLKHNADAHRSGDPDATCSAQLIDSSIRVTNQTVLQVRMRSRKIATARHCRKGPTCVYPAIRDG